MTKMSKDLAIKLFGRTIPLHEAHLNPTALDLSPEPYSESEKVLHRETKSTDKTQETNQTKTPCNSTNQENQEQTPQSKPPITDLNPQENIKPETDNQSGSEKSLKKPDKIIPCPRCNSMDTKFCYYNNYNVNQPRHFCKNCQRYWTAGGTMRNVPVGAGRRKNKHPNAHFRHVMMASPEALLHQQPAPVSGTGTVLKFGTEVPLCESMANALSIKEEKTNNNDVNIDEQSSCTSSIEGGLNLKANNVGPTMQCYPGHGFMWGPAIPLPFIPAASFWPGPWNMPWTGFTNMLPSSPNSNSSSSGNGSPTLGKHSREPSSQVEEKSEKLEKRNNLWAPKTLRIGDPDEAAKSSILTTLGIKRDEKGMFKNFGSKEKAITDAGPVLHANPAALSRFQSFQERT